MSALCLDLLAQPLQKICGYLADRTSRHKAQMHASTVSRQHPVASQRFRIRIVLVCRHFLQPKRLLLFTPTVHGELAHPTPPHLLPVTHSPSPSLPLLVPCAPPLLFPLL